MIYNIFDQNPEDELFPACREMNVAVIARVPFDEGTLTGNLTKESTWPEGDWRNTYFVPENLIPSVERAEEFKKLLKRGTEEHRQRSRCPSWPFDSSSTIRTSAQLFLACVSWAM